MTSGINSVSSSNVELMFSGIQPPPPKGDMTLDNFDTDGDGGITLEELTEEFGSEEAQKIFERDDTNQDGVIDEEEFATAQAKRQEQRPELADLLSMMLEQEGVDEDTSMSLLDYLGGEKDAEDLTDEEETLLDKFVASLKKGNFYSQEKQQGRFLNISA